MAAPFSNVMSSSKYPEEALHFVRRGLDYTSENIHGEMQPDQSPSSRHITGQQLCRGLRDYAIAEYGLLARMVLKRWRIHSTEDFGHIVFILVEHKKLSTTEGDSIRDFIDVYPFDESFPEQIVLPAMLD